MRQVQNYNALADVILVLLVLVSDECAGFMGLASNEGACLFGVGERRRLRLYGLASNEGSGFMG